MGTRCKACCVVGGSPEHLHLGRNHCLTDGTRVRQGEAGHSCTLIVVLVAVAMVVDGGDRGATADHHHSDRHPAIGGKGRTVAGWRW